MKIVSPDFEVLSLVDGQAFVGNIIKRGHEAVLEHASVTVKFTVDRAFPMRLSATGWRPTARRAPAIATTPRTALADRSPLSSPTFWTVAPVGGSSGSWLVNKRKRPILTCSTGAAPRKRPVPFCPTASRRRW